MDHVQVAVRNVDATTEQLHDTVARALAPDAHGKDAADNIRETLSNVNQATVNMAEDTEALKHGFLFRGFFKRRGYYSLASLSPEAVQEQTRCLRMRRIPEHGSKLQTFSSEKPTSRKHFRAQASCGSTPRVAQFGDRAVGDAIVVEGYALSDVPGNALAVSGERAVLVRNYLHRRFRIDNQRIGTVPLRGPASPGRA